MGKFESKIAFIASAVHGQGRSHAIRMDTALSVDAGFTNEAGVPNLSAGGEPAPTFFGAYGQWAQCVPPSWDDVSWLRGQRGGPFMLKG
jgi:hypothetical protein